MKQKIEEAISYYSARRTSEALKNLDSALITNFLIVPVAQPAEDIGDGVHDIPVICLRTLSGKGAIPAFTSVEKMLLWKPEGCQYVSLTGHALIEMASSMPQVEKIVINVDGSPRGQIPSEDFKRLLSIVE